MMNLLILHRLCDGMPERHEDINVKSFISLLKLVKKQSLTIDNACLKPDSEKNICITFDDGYESDFSIAFQLLNEVGMAATFFVVTDWIGKPGFMTKSQIREMYNEGMQIGSHSMSHPDFLKINISSIEKELIESRFKLEDILGAQVTTFAFPYGNAGSTVIDAVIKSGYQLCCTSMHGVACQYSTILPRNSIHGFMSDRDLQRVVDSGATIRLQWKIEDAGKSILKRYFPNNYVKIRTLLVRK